MVASGWDWLTQIDSMQRQMGRLLDHFATSKPPLVQFCPRIWQPAIDVYETEDEVVVLVELAGAKQEEIEIVIDRNTFLIRGARRLNPLGRRRTYYQMEISGGPFERGIVLPVAVDPTQTRASYQEGIVEVILPKAREERTHRVRVRTA